MERCARARHPALSLAMHARLCGTLHARRSAVEGQTDRSYGGGAALHGMLTLRHAMRGHAGKHTVDPDLLTVAQTHGNVHIVTRNAHADDIRAFLQEHGVRHPIHSADLLAPRTPETSAGSCRKAVLGWGLTLDVSFASVLHTANKQPWTYHCCASAHHASARVSAQERLQRAAPAGLLQWKLPSKRPSDTFRSNEPSFGVVRCARR
jgi:hypothetical protein